MEAVLREHLIIREPGPYRSRLLRMARFKRRGRVGSPEDRIVRAFHNAPGYIVVPRGLLPAAQKVAPLQVTDRRLVLPPRDFGWRGELYPYQIAAARELALHDGGFLVAPPGSGKTNIGLAMAAHWRQPTLFVVHTLELQRQALERAHSLFGLPPSAYAVIGEGMGPVEGEEPVVIVAMVQSLAMIEGWMPYLAPRIGAVVLDECHHASSQLWQRVVGKLPARYRLGMSANADRTDGLGPLVRAILGARVTIPLRLLVEAGRVVLPEIRLVHTGFDPANDSLSWADMDRARAQSTSRNRLIVSLAYRASQAKRRCMVLVSRKDHAAFLAKVLVARGVEAYAVTGEVSGERRERLFSLLQRGRAVVIATKVANEGLDLPRLDTLVLGAAADSVQVLEQQVGRTMRTAAGKLAPIVYDLVDAGPAFTRHAENRQTYYRGVGYRVMQQTWR